MGGKPWKYLLLPHDAMVANVTLENLVARYGLRAMIFCQMHPTKIQNFLPLAWLEIACDNRIVPLQ